MPSINPGAKILVTGANGFLGSWLSKSLIQQGFIVRGAVRSLEKGQNLQKLLSVNEKQFQFAVVEDIVKDGAYDEAVQGMDAIIHTASPLTTEGDDSDSFIKPSLLGTLGVFNSALRHGATIKRIVTTSSTGAIMQPTLGPNIVCDETSWSNDPTTVEEQGNAAPMMVKYRASKVLAEKAAWDFYQKHKAEVGWDLVVLHPPMIYGPTLDISLPLNAAVKYWYFVAIKDLPKKEDDLKTSHSYVDVRDVAEAHVRALTREGAGGERIIISAGSITWQELIDLINSVDPPPSLSTPLTKGLPGIEKVYPIRFNNEKGINLLGLQYRKLESTLQDMLADISGRGM